MACLMYAAFKILDPTADIGFELAKEYALANQMKRDRRKPSNEVLDRVEPGVPPHAGAGDEEGDKNTA